MSDITTEALAAELRKMSDNAYCAYIEQMRRDLCLGSEYKLKHGKFGQDNLDAFMRAAEWLGRHKAMHEASVLVSQRTEQNPWRQAVDEALIAHALDCTGPGDDPKEKVKELIEWAVTIATDPRVSERAVLALQPSASAEPVQPPYPEGVVAGPCVCGSWPGGECLKCQWIASSVTAAREQEAACSVIADCSTPTLCLSVGTCKGVHVMPASVRASATGAEPKLPDVCDGVEQDAFEKWAESERFDMSQHPIHWLFLNDKTYAARQGWKAGLLHAVKRVKDATPTTSTTGKVDASHVRDEALEEAAKLCESYGAALSAECAREIRSLIGTPKSAEGEGA